MMPAPNLSFEEYVALALAYRDITGTLPVEAMRYLGKVVQFPNLPDIKESGTAIQPPMPGVAVPVAVPTLTKPPLPKIDFGSGPYWDATLKLTAGKDLNYRAKLLLSLYLSFKNHPLFRERGWIVSPSQEVIAKIFGWSKRDASQARKDLDRAGILEYGYFGLMTEGGSTIATDEDYEQYRRELFVLPPEDGGGTNGIFSLHSLQRRPVRKGTGEVSGGTLVCRFRFAVPVLPEFKLEECGLRPIERRKRKNKAVPLNIKQYQAVPSSTKPALNEDKQYQNEAKEAVPSSTKQYQSPNLAVLSSTESDTKQYQPVHDMNHDSMNEYESFKEKLKSNQYRLAKFEFLAKEAIFNGYNPDRLDLKEAYKFAINDKLSIEKCQDMYEALQALINGGEIIESPPALFHNFLTGKNKPKILPDRKKPPLFNYNSNVPTTPVWDGDTTKLWQEVSRSVEIKLGKPTLAKLMREISLVAVSDGTVHLKTTDFVRRQISESEKTQIQLFIRQKIGVMCNLEFI
jgi:hypothetical protein